MMLVPRASDFLQDRCRLVEKWQIFR